MKNLTRKTYRSKHAFRELVSDLIRRNKKIIYKGESSKAPECYKSGDDLKWLVVY